MRKVTLLLVTAFVFQTGFSQNIEKCREVINLVAESINNKSSQNLMEHLSSDFTIANQKGEVAKIVLNQLINQLNESVLSKDEISSNQTDSYLELKYVFEYENMGEKTTTFLFDKENKLEELELFKMEVKKIDNSKEQANLPESKFIEIPFSLFGNLIAVKVNLNNKKRTFLLDSGAGHTILNSKYFNSNDTTVEKKILSNAKGVGGSISGMDAYKVEELDFAGIKIKNKEVLTLDISHLEEKSLETNTEIYGLIGYDLIKDYDILFDYESKKITLIKPDFYEQYRETKWSNLKLTTVPLRLKKHIPVLNAKIGTEKYAHGIDCGASANLLKVELFEPLEKHLKSVQKDTLVGAGKNFIEVKSGKLKKAIIGGKKFKKMETVFSDISHLNLDGLIGYEMLSKQKTLISYARKTLTFVE